MARPAIDRSLRLAQSFVLVSRQEYDKEYSQSGHGIEGYAKLSVVKAMRPSIQMTHQEYVDPRCPSCGKYPRMIPLEAVA